MPTSLGLIVPLGDERDDRIVAALVDEQIVSSVWVRDLPAVARSDDDTGQGSDPWWYLGGLQGAGVTPQHLGTASIILGIRHPLVTARAATGAHIDTAGRFVLGVGTGGKPEMNRALEVAGRSHAEFASQWTKLRAALDDTGHPEVSLHLPPAYRPPPVYLATSDLTRWEAIDGDADGWQTFLTDDRRRFLDDHHRVCAIRGAATHVDVRLDVDLHDPARAGSRPEFTHPDRGRVRCTADQLPHLLAPWWGEPVGRILLRLTGHAPETALRHLVSSRSDASPSFGPSTVSRTSPLTNEVSADGVHSRGS